MLSAVEAALVTIVGVSQPARGRIKRLAAGRASFRCDFGIAALHVCERASFSAALGIPDPNAIPRH